MDNRAHWKRGFFTIATGQTVSLIGSSAVQFSLIWWLASETASPLMMSLAGLVAFFPQAVLGPFAGVWIDRWKRKTVIIGADLFMGLTAAALALFFLVGTPPYWSACVVLALRAVGNVFHTPAIQAAIPMLVPQEELVRANGWSQFMQSGAFMLGPVLGAAMYAALPLWLILLTDLVGAAVACLTVAAVIIPDPEKQARQVPHFMEEFKEGARVFLQNRQLTIMSLTTMLCLVFFMPLSSFYPLMTSGYFQATAWHASVVELTYAAGMAVSAGLIGKYGHFKNKLKAVYLGLLVMGVSSLLCGVLPPTMAGFWAFAVLCAFLGGGGTFYNIPCIAYMQEVIPPATLGRAFSLYGSVLSLTMPVGLLIAGPVAQVGGVALWFFITGGAFLVITAVGWWLIRLSKKNL